MRIKYTEMRPRDSVWIRTTVDRDGVWSIVVGQVANATAESVMLFDTTTWSYKLSKQLGIEKHTNRVWDASRIDTIMTLGS